MIWPVILLIQPSSSLNPNAVLNSSRRLSVFPSIFLTRVNFKLPPRFASVYTGNSFDGVRVTKYGRLGAD